MRELSAAESKQFDQYIFQRNILVGLVFLRERLDLPLPDALRVFKERYEALRQTEGNRFTVSDKEYFEGFYS